MKICVFGAASPTIDPEYIRKTEALGKTLAERGHELVFGGGANGLMGAAARGFKNGGGKITGVIPRFFNDEEIEVICDFCTELIYTDSMRVRKQIMEDLSDAFVVVPGGIGTYEEFFEVLTLKQLCRHKKPIAVYNINRYYDKLHETMLEAMDKNFINHSCSVLYKLTDSVDELIRCVEAPDEDNLSVRELKKG